MSKTKGSSSPLVNSNSNSKNNLSCQTSSPSASSNFTSKFCCTKSNSADEANIDQKLTIKNRNINNNNKNILNENNFKYIDEELLSPYGSKISIGDRKATSSSSSTVDKNIKNNPKSLDSSQKRKFYSNNNNNNKNNNSNKKPEIIDDIQKQEEISPKVTVTVKNSPPSQEQIFEERCDLKKSINPSTNNSKTKIDVFDDHKGSKFPSMSKRNEVKQEMYGNGSIQRQSGQRIQSNSLENKNDKDIRKGPDKSKDLSNSDEQNTMSSTISGVGGNNGGNGGILARVIITNFKQVPSQKEEGSNINLVDPVNSRIEDSPTVTSSTLLTSTIPSSPPPSSSTSASISTIISCTNSVSGTTDADGVTASITSSIAASPISGVASPIVVVGDGKTQKDFNLVVNEITVKSDLNRNNKKEVEKLCSNVSSDVVTIATTTTTTANSTISSTTPITTTTTTTIVTAMRKKLINEKVNNKNICLGDDSKIEKGVISKVIKKVNNTGDSIVIGEMNNKKNEVNFNGTTISNSSNIVTSSANSTSGGTTNINNNTVVVGDDGDGDDNSEIVNNLLDDDEDNPYNELQEYLERIKREINEAFEQHQLRNDELLGSSSPDSKATAAANCNKLVSNEKQFFFNDTKTNGRELNEICSSSQESGKLTAAAKVSNILTRLLPPPTSSSSSDYNQEKLEFQRNQLKPSTVMQHQQKTQQQQQQQIKHLGVAEDAGSSINNITTSSHNARDSGDVNIWANSILKELDNLMASDKHSTFTLENNRNEKTQARNILKPEKHATIPLQSFNLNVQTTESKKSLQPKKVAIANNPKTASIYSQKNSPIQDITVKDNLTKYPLSILKIEEDNKCIASAGTMTSSPDSVGSSSKKENIQQNFSGLLNGGSGGGGGAKKGSTSTIWTSEESILRSMGTVDEDNKSTSSSACEDTSTALSSGKSLDSSENDNDSNEIPSDNNSKLRRFNKNEFYNRNSNNNKIDNRTIVQNSQDICDPYPFRRNKLYTNNNINNNPNHFNSNNNNNNINNFTTIDEPDLLEVLSLCGGINYDDDLLISNMNYFDSIDASKTSDFDNNDNDEVILRNKSKLEINETNSSADINKNHNYNTTGTGAGTIERNRKCRSHSIAESSFPQIQNDCEQIYDKFPIINKNIKPKRPFYLPFTQEPFRNGNSSNIRELPSPSSASLHSGHHENVIIQELTTKSNSAPILLKKEKRNDVFSGQQNSLRYSRSQSDRYLAEIEAIEACKWLRAAGFPQYAQMYEDHQFPIDLSSVAKDHPLLENDPLQSLYRRLCILNRCATMRLDNARKHGEQKDDSDDEGFALSENWTFQPQSRRWSRIGETGLELPTKQIADKADGSSKDSSPDRYEDEVHASANMAFSTLPLHSDQDQMEGDAATNRLRRTGSERLKDGAKAFLRRVESIKSRRRKRQNREGLVISGPQMLDFNNFTPKDTKTQNVTLSNPPSPMAGSPIYPRNTLFGNELKVPTTENEKYLSPNRLSPKRMPTTPKSVRTSPLHFFAQTMPHLIEGKSDDSSSYCSDSQESSSGLVTMRRQRSRRFLQRTGKVDDIGIHSDSECHQPVGMTVVYKDSNSNNKEVKVKKLTRGGSLNLGKDKKRGAFQSRSFRARTSNRKNFVSSESDKEDSSKSKSPVVRWHSFREKEHVPVIFKKCLTSKNDTKSLEGTPFAALSCGQLQIIRKLALVTLTGYMERYCPSHRSGWNWELPKFIKKIKTPDYKDKKVFGLPFVLVLQRTGYSLPFPIRAAIRWLRLNAFDQIGLFRKSGVKSRIAKLKEMIEGSDVDCMDIYDTQQAYDVADMLKQYFRDLPETLLTSKMSETFVAIFHHLPPEVRAEAVQSAVLLLPDEHREVLYSLLEFLHEIAANSEYNQMTANNLAVCWAPSLFSSNIALGRSVAVSPRRRKVAGVPDMKELSETKASHECLAFLITNYKQTFTATHEKMKHCNFGYLEESKPVPLEALGEGLPFQNWRGYLFECTSATIKEGREKTRGWVSVTSFDQNVEIAFKKVGDGHPLRLWRFITEVEAPPIEVLDYILKERSSWDINLIKSRTVQKLDERNEIFQYTCDGQTLTDYCVLRSWQSDLPKGACVIVEASVEHANASIMPGAVRGVVLASRFLIEPCGSGRSRLMHLARVDTKGRTPEFYNKCYGHICSHYLSKIRSVFRHITDGPESKV